MNKPLPTISAHGDHNENIERIVKILGRSPLRANIFKAVYARGSRSRSSTEVLAMIDADSGQRKSVLNELLYLANHEVISKEKAPNGVAERFTYGKIPYVKANKAEILKGVARPDLVKRMPTKRRPPVQINGRTNRTRSRPTRKLSVLFVAAVPSSHDHLRTDAEFRMIQDEVRRSLYRDSVDFFIKPAADMKSMLEGMNDHRPEIVHFSGHGGGEEILFDDGKVVGSVGKPLRFKLLAEALGATSTPPKLLVLNACDTSSGADVFLDVVEGVVAMSDDISDIGAAIFSAAFYAAIASGQPLSSAIKQGVVRMKAAVLADAHVPRLTCRDDVNPNKYTLAGKK